MWLAGSRRKSLTEARVLDCCSVIHWWGRSFSSSMYMMSCHPAEETFTHNLLPPCYLVDIILKGDIWTEFVVFTSSLIEMVILWIFLLLYRHFVIKTRWNTINCSKNDHICSGKLSLFFLIGTANVKQNHIVLNETVLRWRQLMGNKWRLRDHGDLTVTLSGSGRREGAWAWACTLP